MNSNVKAVKVSKGVDDMDKFKRRLIRAVARLLLQENKPEEDVWTDLRKETGCDCKLLWTRIRALTLKKLSRLFAADDRIDAIPKAARMSLTDWLLFDLVLVHQKIDLIGQDNSLKDSKEDPKPLVDLFELVKMFKIEGRSGESLAEAWSTATLYYNNQGHQCSPMLLQRRWYQLKEATRAKFYDFWYAYRGAAKRLSLAEPHMPSKLQAAIAGSFKSVVTGPFVEWEELIKLRLVTMPEEFERKMMEKSSRILKKRLVTMSDVDGPDLELIEPNIETIDLGLESDNENEKSTEVETAPTTVRIKEEPLDFDIDIDETQLESPKKSMYEEVLELTTIENEKLDNMNIIESLPLDEEVATEENEIEESIESTLRTQEEPILPQITSVFGNVSDTSAICNVDNTNEVASVDNNSVIENVHDNSDIKKESDNVSDNIDEGNENLSKMTDLNDQIITTTVIEVVATVSHVENDENSKKTAFINDSKEGNVVVVEEIQDIVKIHDVEEIHEIKETLDIVTIPDVEEIQDIEESDTEKSPENEKQDEIEELHEIEEPHEMEEAHETEEPHEVEESHEIDEPHELKEAHKIEDTNEINEPHELEEIHEIKDTPVFESNPDPEMDIDIKPDIKDYLLTVPFKVSNINRDGEMVENVVDKKIEIKMKPDVKFSFGELSNNINFVDDGIEFVDDGIEYYDEDSDTDMKVKIEIDDEENTEEDTPKIDEKLLMCPIIYTTRLDNMGLFDTASFDHIKGTQILDVITSKSKPVKKLPVDTSPPGEEDEEDDECEENIVTDSQRVKPSSYLLQKPRSRSYNPIQLCKNPDFNTRLKRLTVGFFSYPRNRGLIKSCKPLTIDLSKAFESKLVAGTLYLKPSDHNVSPTIVDDTESSQSVSVVPSAMPAQSLIDNSKICDILPVYQSYSVSPKPLNDLGSTSERNKVINLPDISEVRRINQQLLIAEVTPMQVKNNMLKVPVSLVTSSNNDTTPVQAFSNTAQIDQDILKTSDDCRGPPKIVDITQDLPSDNNSVRKYINESVNRPPQEESNQTYRYAGRPPKMVNGKRLWPVKPSVVPWKPRQIRHEIPWLTRNSEAACSTQYKEDTLLTLDTLNKMLYLLAYDKEDQANLQLPKPKKKKNSQRQLKEQTSEKTPPVSDDSSDIQILSETPHTEKKQKLQEIGTKKCCKPKINIKSATNYPRNQKEKKSITADSDNAEVNISFKDLKKTDEEQSEDTEIKYCCWARQRMLQMLFSRKRIPPHECPFPLCTCCCRTLLQRYVINDHKIKKATSLSNPIDLDDIQENIPESSKNTNSCVEIVVESPGDATSLDANERQVKIRVEVPVQTPVETQVLDVEPIKDDSTVNLMESEPIDLDALNDVPSLGSEVSVTTSVVPLLTLEVDPPLNVGPKNDTILSPSVDPKNATMVSTTGAPAIKTRAHKGGYRLRVAPRLDQNSSPNPGQLLPTKPLITSKKADISPSLAKLLAAKKTNNQPKVTKFTRFPSNVKTYSQLKNFKEKMIFLNSKQLSGKPAENPIFLGKNKILLTTVKFPAYLRKFEEAKQKLGPSLKLPHGVQLICLPNGTVTYTMDPNVEVNALELTNVPAIVEAVQAQINSSVAQTDMLPKVSLVHNEVVNLIDDDDDVTPDVNGSIDKNTETPLSVEVKTTEVDVTKNCEDSPHTSLQTLTEVKCAQSNNENSKRHSIETQTEDIQNTNADETVSDVGENVQEANHKEIASTSTEQNQPEAENIEEHEKSTSEPSSVNKSKNNILSDLMEMWGIFDEDATPTPEETLPENPPEPVVEMHSAMETPLPLSSEPVVEQPAVTVTLASEYQPTISSVEPPPLAPVTQPSESTLPHCPILVPKPAFGNALTASSVPPIVKSPIGDLSPITSLYELKYACLNNGSFFKLDFETGYLVPINVCMKQHPKPSLIPLKPVVTKSVIDLTDDDDSVKKSSNSPNKNKKSLLISNNLQTESEALVQSAECTSVTDTQVKPVKLFRAITPGILQRINQNKKIIREQKTFVVTNKTEDRRRKRKQCLKETNVDVTIRVRKQYVNKIKPTNNDLDVTDNPTDKAIRDPVPTLPIESENKSAPNIESDDSSDEEPLSKIAKRKRENELLPAVQNEVEAAVQSEVAAGVQNEVEVAVQNEFVAAVQNEVEDDLPVSDSGDVYMSDQEPIDPEAHYEIVMDQDNDEEMEEENCILGV